MRKDIERFMREHECYVCKGARLKPVVLAVTIHDLNIMDICNLDIDNALDYFSTPLKLDERIFYRHTNHQEIISRLSL